MDYYKDIAIDARKQKQQDPLKRTKRVELQLNGEEYTIISDAARRSGLSLAAYIRRAALDSAYII